jgi:transforming growth factor-beta-induced protein
LSPKLKHAIKHNDETMKLNRILTVAALTAAVTLTPNFCASAAGKSAAAKAAKPGTSTIVALVLQPDGEFDVLQAAVVRAGLVDALNGRTQYTVFAPTDAAFVATLGVADEAAAIEAVNALPVDVLTHILLYHVTEGRRISTSVLAAPEYRMLNGESLSREDLAAAGLAVTDISASNGVVHVINAVLIP